ncbi:MAG: phosphoenolpyruvate-protein phosphotransferase PtsP [Desulfobacteraceae bacterium]|nr:MAG: phosphoenolpyruvate-protein phosphotransferase PtsP [Desulfobacteraceae bacterium]
MLANSRQIVKEIGGKTQLKEALALVVQRAKSSMDADACSVYLKDTPTDQYLLKAADGLISGAVGKARVSRNEGLVGWVAAHEEVVNLANAPDHPGFHHIAETEEESFHGFMGAPIVHHGRVLGVIVAQKHERRRFDNDEAAFFTTLATQLGGAINHLLAKSDFSRQLNGPSRGRILIKGIPCAPGLAIGSLLLSQPADLLSTPDRRAPDIAAEEAAFQAAVSAAKEELRASGERMSAYLPGEVLSLFDAYVMMLESEKLNAGTVARIRKGQWARGALRDTILELALVFEQTEDPYLAARAEDIRNIGRHILLHLQGTARASGEYPRQCILAGMELSLAEISNVPRDRLSGIISVKGSAVSHTAIICRALGVPAVMGLTDLPIGYLENCEIAVDGQQGVVCINPSPADINEFRQRMQEEQAISAELESLRDKPARTVDGVLVPLFLNLGIGADEVSARAAEYEGVGLYRTEFFFIARDTLPTEDEQYSLYRHLLESFAPKPVTIRTLDTGGDKELPFFTTAETNPFLGRRGIRFTLDHPEIFLTQLRALLRANAGINNLQILFPMISRVNEIDAALGLLDRAYLDLTAEGQPAAKPQIGAMIEVPSAVYLIAALSRRVDFFSIGTNDLTQYLLAVDRSNPRVQGCHDNLHPAVIHVIGDIVHRAHRQNKPVGVCGEMAGDPASALLLLGIGVDSLSMTSSSLPRVKWTLRTFTSRQARELADKALKSENEADTHQLLNNALSAAGLNALVRR